MNGKFVKDAERNPFRPRVEPHKTKRICQICKAECQLSSIPMDRRKDQKCKSPEEHKSCESTILQNFRRIDVLGKGAFGEVCNVRDMVTGKYMAKKTYLEIPQAVDNFLNEVEMLRKVQGGENVIQFIGHCKIRENYQTKLCIFMEFFDGVNLYEFTKHRLLDEKKTKKVLYQIGVALKFIHQRGVIHRDVKPANILLNESGKVKLVDFGLAEAGPETSGICGTQGYMAPEIFDGQLGPIGYPSDYYSAGIIAYELHFYMRPKDYGKKFVNQLNFDWNKEYFDLQHELSGLVRFPHPVAKETESFLLGCLNRVPGQRLSDETYLNHRYFLPEHHELKNM